MGVVPAALPACAVAADGLGVPACAVAADGLGALHTQRGTRHIAAARSPRRAAGPAVLQEGARAGLARSGRHPPVFAARWRAVAAAVGVLALAGRLRRWRLGAIRLLLLHLSRCRGPRELMFSFFFVTCVQDSRHLGCRRAAAHMMVGSTLDPHDGGNAPSRHGLRQGRGQERICAPAGSYAAGPPAA